MADGLSKWLAVGCAGLIALTCLGSGIAGALVFTTLSNSDAYTLADGWVKGHPAVIERVGEPTTTGWFPQGSISAVVDGQQSAEFTHHVSGPRGEAVVHTTLYYRDGAWAIGQASVDEGGRPVPLAVAGEGTKAAAEAAEASVVRVADQLTAAQKAYEEGRDADVIAAADVVLELDPSQADAHYWRGRAEARQGDHERAIADFEAAVHERPDFLDAWKGLAYANTRAGHDGEAIVALDRVLTLAPDDAKAWADRADAKYRAGDRRGARADAAASCQRSYQPGCDLEARLAKMGG